MIANSNFAKNEKNVEKSRKGKLERFMLESERSVLKKDMEVRMADE